MYIILCIFYMLYLVISMMELIIIGIIKMMDKIMIMDGNKVYLYLFLKL